MNDLKAVLLLAAACMLGGCAAERGTRDTADDEAAIRDLIARTAALNNAADTLGWVALFEDGGVYMGSGIPEVTTRSGLLDVAAAGFGPYAAAVQITPVEIVILGDWAFARSHVTGAATPRAGGEPIPVDAKQLTLYHRQPDGTWKVARLIVNSNG
jgi:uncharacterized protein (TIGR02246 family)